MTTFVADEHVENLSDLVRRLGEAPLNRILLQPASGLAIEADMLALLSQTRKRICDLVDGILIEKAPGFLQHLLATRLGAEVSRLFGDLDDRQ